MMLPNILIPVLISHFHLICCSFVIIYVIHRPFTRTRYPIITYIKTFSKRTRWQSPGISSIHIGRKQHLYDVCLHALVGLVCGILTSGS